MARTASAGKEGHTHLYDETDIPDHQPMIGEHDQLRAGATDAWWNEERVGLSADPGEMLHDHKKGSIWKNPETEELEGFTGPGGKDGHIHEAGTLEGGVRGTDFF